MSKRFGQLAKDFVIHKFDTIKGNSYVEDGINKLLYSTTRKSGYKTERLMVVKRDDNVTLVGIITIHQGFHDYLFGREIQ